MKWPRNHFWLTLLMIVDQMVGNRRWVESMKLSSHHLVCSSSYIFRWSWKRKKRESKSGSNEGHWLPTGWWVESMKWFSSHLLCWHCKNNWMDKILWHHHLIKRTMLSQLRVTMIGGDRIVWWIVHILRLDQSILQETIAMHEINFLLARALLDKVSINGLIDEDSWTMPW